VNPFRPKGVEPAAAVIGLKAWDDMDHTRSAAIAHEGADSEPFGAVEDRTSPSGHDMDTVAEQERESEATVLRRFAGL
jgi:hypothetical protein